MAITKRTKSAAVEGWSAEQILEKLGSGYSMEAINDALASFGSVSSDDELATFRATLPQMPVLKPEPTAPAIEPQPESPHLSTDGQISTEVFASAIKGDVQSAKQQMQAMRLKAQAELTKAAQEEAALYHQFKGGLATAFAGFLGAASWQPVEIEFEALPESDPLLLKSA